MDEGEVGEAAALLGTGDDELEISDKLATSDSDVLRVVDVMITVDVLSGVVGAETEGRTSD